MNKLFISLALVLTTFAQKTWPNNITWADAWNAVKETDTKNAPKLAQTSKDKMTNTPGKLEFKNQFHCT